MEFSAALDTHIPLWGLLTSGFSILFVVTLFIVRMHIKIRELEGRIAISEQRLNEGDKDFKEVNRELKNMSMLLTEIKTQITFVLRIAEERDNNRN